VAQGDFIAFLDADDLWLPEKTERQLGVMRCRPEIDLCVAYFRNFWDPEVVDEAPQYRDDSFSRPMSGYIVPTLLARRDVFDRFGGFGSDGNPSETAWFARAVAAGARLETLDDVVLQRRIHRANDSRLKPTSLDGLFQLIQMKNRGA
jgi:glycosyltransferase involved in cell wall biosynthesis